MKTRIPLGIVLSVLLFGLGGAALAGTAGAADVTATEEPTAVAAGGQQGPTVLADGHVNDCAAAPPSDHADPDGETGDVVGWVEGYWYNEPVAVTPSDGFNQTELQRLSKRTAARVEALRCLTYDEGIPPLETVSRDEYQADLEQAFEEEVTVEGELFENGQLATRLTVGQNEDAIQAQIEARAAAPAAFYDTEEEYMAFVTDSETVEGLDQTILAHELTHALQDQNFNLSVVFEQPTNDRYLSSAGVVEGDADLVQGLYRDNCGGDWNDECIIPENQEPPDIPNWTLILNQLSVYHMPLVEDTYDSSGLDGVNPLFEDWPDTTTETINPELYNNFEATEVTVEDQSNENWRRVQSGNVTYDTVGQAGITAMFMTPSFASGFQNNIVSDPQGFIEQSTPPQKFDYGIPETQGWQGDRIYGYADGENRTAGVWASVWENGDEASEFARTYEALIEYRDGALAEGYENVYTFEDSQAYDMAVAIDQTDERVDIVTAPSIDALTAVHEGVELQEDTGSDDGTDDSSGDDGTDDGMDDGGDDADGSEDDGGDDEEGSGDDSGPGFGLLAAAAALLAVALAAWARHR